MYERLLSSKRLLTAMDAYATELKASHEAWKNLLDQAHPGSDPRQIASEAMELAVRTSRTVYPPRHRWTQRNRLSLDELMNHFREESVFVFVVILSK